MFQQHPTPYPDLPKEVKSMQTPAFPALQSRVKSLTDRSSTSSSIDTHAVFDVVRSLFLSSILWAILAVAVYEVYSMIVGTH
jgi:hypothetical protein